ncbi:hypothetical protein HS048_31045 [Planomonospora sp. ID91781]|uniref:hypothetical protein n=1 Tax=Planomonospora sp. ID91781 TaxID=2738135 RepID=UPI0018C43E1E|nr:hypothetical protein [Planomonospora sp. ID91781]MBG0825132.1 hypothetical protein [Planomonospora sp. ID91781]
MLAGITALTACTSDGQASGNTATPPTPSLAAIGTDPIILVHANRRGSQMMPLNARLKWIEDGSCLVMITAEHPPEQTVIPVWPENTVPLRAPDGRRGVTTPAGEQILDGDTVSGGGSWIRPDHPAYARYPPPAGCHGHDAFFVIDSTDLHRM